MPTIANSHLPKPKGWDEFEDIVLSAAKLRWRNPNFFRNGRQGQRQKGVDVYGKNLEHRFIGVQCKNTVLGLGREIIEKEAAKAESFRPGLSELFIATTADRDEPIQQYVRDLSEQRRQRGLFPIYILFWDDICADLCADISVIDQHFPQVRNHPSVREKQRWTWHSVVGNAFSLQGGLAATADSPGGFPASTFPAASTVVLGAATTKVMETISGTAAAWKIPIAREVVAHFERGYLIVAAIRFFAGLHSKFYDSKAEIQLNRAFVDHIGLRERPPHHSDYFHSLPLPNFPLPDEISHCQNIYAWPLLKNAIVDGPEQVLTVRIGNLVRWDIDFVGLLIRRMEKPYAGAASTSEDFG